MPNIASTKAGLSFSTPSMYAHRILFAICKLPTHGSNSYYLPTLYFKPLYRSTKLLNTPPISPFLPWTKLYSSPLKYFCPNPQYLHDFISYLWSTPCCPSFKILHQIPYGRSTTNCHQIPCSQQAQVR